MTEITARLSTALANRYQLERYIGEVGMATVYLEDLRHKRKVAVKVLRPELAAVLGAERFLQEITTTANLQHPHILPLFDSGEADSFLILVRDDYLDRSWNLMPDGRHFVMLRDNPASAPGLRIVRNWTAELKAKVGN